MLREILQRAGRRREAGGAGPDTRPPAISRDVALAGLMINVLAIALPLTILQVYDRVLPNRTGATLAWLVVGLIGVLVVEAALRIARSAILASAAARFEHRATCLAVDRLLGCDLATYEGLTPAAHLNRLEAIDVLRDHYAGPLRLIAIDLPFALLFIVLIWVVGGHLVLVPLAIAVVSAVAAYSVARALRRVLDERASLDDRRYGFVLEVLEGLATIKAMAMESLMIRRFERLATANAAGYYQMVLLSNAAQTLAGLAANVTMIAVAALGARSVMAEQMSLGALAAVILLSGRAIQLPVRTLGAWSNLQTLGLAERRLRQILDMRRERRGDARVEKPLAGAIELRGVAYQPPGAVAPLFSGIDLSIGPGEAIGICGDAGSGKSTLLALLMGLRQPTAGEIRIDGRDLAVYDLASIRRQMAYMPQTDVLFQGTILDNLTLFGGGRTRGGACVSAVEDGRAIMRALGLEAIIDRLPEGYGTRIGEAAERHLSPAIKQGIAIARAMATRPRIVLFDEANGAFDRTMDERLKALLRDMKGQATMIIVSYRPSLLSLADRAYELRQGHLLPWVATPASARPRAAEAIATATTAEPPRAAASAGR